MKKSLCVVFVVGLVLAGCSSGNKKKGDLQGAVAIKAFELEEVWRTDTLLRTPESVIYDKTRDQLYVSNLNMEPRLKDGNGFISILSTDGSIMNLRWVEGLSSPKGMAIIADTLFVADVDELVLIDMVQGKIIRKIPVEGAGMLNDITPAPGGGLFFTDTDAGKIHFYDKGVVTDWLTEGLSGPNGLLVDNDRLMVASQGSNDFAAIDLVTKARTLLTDSIGGGDGIVATGTPGYFVVSDWFGEIYMVHPGNHKVSLLNTKEAGSNTADIEYLPDANLLLVPTFFKNSVVAYRLREKTDGR